MSGPVVRVDVAQGTEAWLSVRRTRYGASELPMLVGLTSGAGRVWRAKLGEPDRLSGLHLELGHRLEPWALELWSREMRRDVERGPVLAEERGWLLASLDGASEGEPVEAKVRSRGSPDWACWTAEAVPGAVELQVRQQAALSEVALGRRLEAGHVTVLLLDGWGVEHRTYRIPLTAERREEWADVYAPYPGRWHAAYVATRRPPPEATAADVAVLVDTVRVRQREATAEERALVAALAVAEEQRRAAARVAAAAERDRDAVRDELARLLGPDAAVPGVRWAARRNHPPLLKLEE